MGSSLPLNETEIIKLEWHGISFLGPRLLQRLTAKGDNNNDQLNVVFLSLGSLDVQLRHSHHVQMPLFGYIGTMGKYT